MKKLTNITWTIEIDGRKYGAKFDLDMQSPEEVADAIDLVAQQMKESAKAIMTDENPQPSDLNR